MNEVIDNKVDKFHEALINRFTKKALVVVAIVIILFASWYVAATRKEYDRWENEATWAIVLRVIIIDGELKELNISFGQFGFPLDPSIANLTTMVYANNITKNGHSIYWEHACLADAQFQSLYHVKEFLGHTEYGRPIGHRMVMHYYYTLLCFLPDPFDILPNDRGRYTDGLGFLSGTIVEPENLRAYEEFNDLPLSYLQDIALNRLAEVYKVLKAQEKIFVQGKEYQANFCGDGYIGENEYPCLED